MSTIAPLNLRN